MVDIAVEKATITEKAACLLFQQQVYRNLQNILLHVYSHWTSSSAAFSYLPSPPHVHDSLCSETNDVCGGEHRCREGDFFSKSYIFYFSRFTTVLEKVVSKTGVGLLTA